MLTQQNTEGYTEYELADLNFEWDSIVESEELEEYTEDYNIRYSQFCDEIARR